MGPVTRASKKKVRLNQIKSRTSRIFFQKKETTIEHTEMSNSFLPAIDRLKGQENYDDWKFAVQAYFEHEGLWKSVTGVEESESQLTKAKSKLILLVDPINYVHIKSATTAKDIWNRLSDAFEDSGLTRKVNLLRGLLSTKLIDCSSVEDYVNKIINSAHKLNGVGLTVPEEWIGTILLVGLPDEYKPMIMALENSGIKITGDSIKTKLLQEVKGEMQFGEAAFFARGQAKKQKNKNFRCFVCDETGHFAKNCPSKKTNNESNEKALWCLY